MAKLLSLAVLVFLPSVLAPNADLVDCFFSPISPLDEAKLLSFDAPADPKPDAKPLPKTPDEVKPDLALGLERFPKGDDEDVAPSLADGFSDVEGARLDAKGDFADSLACELGDADPVGCLGSDEDPFSQEGPDEIALKGEEVEVFANPPEWVG